LIGGTGLSLAAATPANAGGTKTWNVNTDFGKHPTLNPAPDKYHDAGVWSWLHGSLNTPGSYALNTYSSPTAQQAGCGSHVKKQYAWIDSGGDPSFIYGKKTIPVGEDNCAPRDTLTKDVLYMSPYWSGDPGGSPAAIIEWKSPITGSVTVSGSLTGVDPDETGITYELDQGTTPLIGPSTEGGDSTASFGPLSVSVTAGQSLYLEMGDGSSGSGGADEIGVNFTISS
jgi:hypothetical protein